MNYNFIVYTHIIIIRHVLHMYVRMVRCTFGVCSVFFQVIISVYCRPIVVADIAI